MPARRERRRGWGQLHHRPVDNSGRHRRHRRRSRWLQQIVPGFIDRENRAAGIKTSAMLAGNTCRMFGSRSVPAAVALGRSGWTDMIKIPPLARGAVLDGAISNQVSSTVCSSLGLTGLATWSSIPAARQRSRSPCMALAVMATMGVWADSPSIFRIKAVASNPSTSGIWRSMKIRVGCPFVGGDRLLAIAGHVDPIAKFLQHFARHLFG